MSLQRLPNFRKQSAILFGLTVLDPVEDTNNENAEHTTFYVKNPEPNRGKKNHDLPPVGFSHQSLNGQKRYKVTPTCYKVTHTHPTTLGHTYLVFPRQVTQHNVLVPLELDTLNSLNTREKRKHLTKLLLLTS